MIHFTFNCDGQRDYSTVCSSKVHPNTQQEIPSAKWAVESLLPLQPLPCKTSADWKQSTLKELCGIARFHLCCASQISQHELTSITAPSRSNIPHCYVNFSGEIVSQWGNVLLWCMNWDPICRFCISYRLSEWKLEWSVNLSERTFSY